MYFSKFEFDKIFIQKFPIFEKFSSSKGIEKENISKIEWEIHKN